MDARTYSHPARWMYGGILDRMGWEAGDATVQLWNGDRQPVGNGDEVLVLRTACHVQVVAVERGTDA